MRATLPDRPVRKGTRDAQEYPANRDRHRHRDFEELEPYRGRLRVVELSILERDTPELDDEQIGDRREPEPELVCPELVCPERVARGSVREEIQLLLLDPVLHVAAGAVQVLVQLARGPGRGVQFGHDEARVGALREMLGLADDPARPRPVVPCPVPQLLEHA